MTKSMYQLLSSLVPHLHYIAPPHIFKCKILAHTCVPLGYTVHPEWRTVQNKGCTQTGILLVRIPYIYWKIGLSECYTGNDSNLHCNV